MILQYIQNAGADGAKRYAILEYLQGTLPGRLLHVYNKGDVIRQRVVDEFKIPMKKYRMTENFIYQFNNRIPN